jgi:drug/metabolite transporter (DMT)-like permease
MFLDEHLTPGTALGSVIILAGVVLVARVPQRAATRMDKSAR